MLIDGFRRSRWNINFACPCRCKGTGNFFEGLALGLWNKEYDEDDEEDQQHDEYDERVL